MVRRATRTAARAAALLLIAAALPHAPTSFDEVTTFCRTPCDQSLNPATRHAVLAVIGTFRSMRTGNLGERAVAETAYAAAQAHGGIDRFYMRSCMLRDRGLFQRND